MLKRLIATITTAGLLLLPTTPLMAKAQHIQRAPAHTSDSQLSPAEMIDEAVFNLASEAVSHQGYVVGMSLRDEAAITQVFGPDILDGSLPVQLQLNDDLRAVVVIPLSTVEASNDVPLAIFSGDSLEGSYRVLIDGDMARIALPNGMALADIPLMGDGQSLTIDLAHGGAIFAIDLPDFSLGGLIDALQSVLDLLYTVKALINSIICAVQAAVDLLYGLTACGVGETQVGGGNIIGNVQCSIPRVQTFIQTVSSYCF